MCTWSCAEWHRRCCLQCSRVWVAQTGFMDLMIMRDHPQRHANAMPSHSCLKSSQAWAADSQQEWYGHDHLWDLPTKKDMPLLYHDTLFKNHLFKNLT
jgi:hypothetical protein